MLNIYFLNAQMKKACLAYKKIQFKLYNCLENFIVGFVADNNELTQIYIVFSLLLHSEFTNMKYAVESKT